MVYFKSFLAVTLNIALAVATANYLQTSKPFRIVHPGTKQSWTFDNGVIRLGSNDKPAMEIEIVKSITVLKSEEGHFALHDRNAGDAGYVQNFLRFRVYEMFNKLTCTKTDISFSWIFEDAGIGLVRIHNPDGNHGINYVGYDKFENKVLAVDRNDRRIVNWRLEPIDDALPIKDEVKINNYYEITHPVLHREWVVDEYGWGPDCGGRFCIRNVISIRRLDLDEKPLIIFISEAVFNSSEKILKLRNHEDRYLYHNDSALHLHHFIPVFDPGWKLVPLSDDGKSFFIQTEYGANQASGRYVVGYDDKLDQVMIVPRNDPRATPWLFKKFNPCAKFEKVNDQVTVPVDKPVTEAVAESVSAPINNPVAPEPVPAPITEPVVKPATKPVADSASVPITDPVVKPVAKSVAESASAPIADPAVKHIALEPVTESMSAPSTGNTAEPVLIDSNVKPVEPPAMIPAPIEPPKPQCQCSCHFGVEDYLMQAALAAVAGASFALFRFLLNRYEQKRANMQSPSSYKHLLMEDAEN